MYMPENGSVDIIHTGAGGFGFGNAVGMSTDEIKRFQTFIAPAHCTGISGIQAKLRRIAGSPYGGPHVELYATSNGLPTGAPLASMLFGAIGTTFDVAWTPLSASGLVPGAVYAIVLGTMSYPDPKNNQRFEWAVAPVYDNLRFGKWNGKGWVDESGLGNGWLAIDIIDADNAIDVTHSGTSGCTVGQAQDQVKRYQTFLARGDQPVVGVDLKLRKIQGTTQSDVVVDLYACSAHKPAGSPLATAAIPSGSIGSGWTVVNAPLRYPALAFEQEYAIVVGQRTPGSSPYEWAVGPVSRTTFFGKGNGSSWTDESSVGDGWLKVWLRPPLYPATVDVTPPAVHGNGFGDVTNEIERYQTFTLSQPSTVLGVDLMLRKFNGSGQSDVVAQLFAARGGRIAHGLEGVGGKTHGLGSTIGGLEVKPGLAAMTPVAPWGACLASGTIPAGQIGTDWAIVHAPLKSAALSAGTYALVLSQRTPAPARYEWGVGAVRARCVFGKGDGRVWVDESGLGAGWTRVWISQADITIDLSHASPGGYGFGNSTNEVKRFQTFTTPGQPSYNGYSVNGLQVKVRKAFGSDQGDLIAELYRTENNRPTGLPRSTAVVPSSRITTDWTVVDLALFFDEDWFGHGLAAGRKYAVVLSQRQAHAARYEWATGPADAGEQFGKGDGASWTDESSLGGGWMKVSLIECISPN